MHQLLIHLPTILGLLVIVPSLVTASPVNTTIVPKRDSRWGFPYGSTKVRGVNLGGWLVLEAWMTPSLFVPLNDDRIVDEYTFSQYQDYETAHTALVNHWDSWITLSDFQAIKDAGLNHVRLPIGYWAWDVSHGEPYHQGQLFYLEQAVIWARSLGLKIILDLHGVPGSQNGFDNSGQRTSNPSWHKDNDNIARSLKVVKAMASWYADQTDVVTAIQSLNEPAGFLGGNILDVLRQYWYDSYGNIRYPYGTDRQGDAVQILHDAFQPLDYWKGFMTDGFDGVIMDTHYYGVFSDENLARTKDQQISAACDQAAGIRDFDLWTLVGEWSVATTDCANKVYGPNGGSRYDGTYAFGRSSYIGSCDPYTGSGADYSESHKEFLRKFYEAQTSSFEAGVGWIYWSWKTEVADEWSYSKGLQYGWIPQDPTERQYPSVCG